MNNIQSCLEWVGSAPDLADARYQLKRLMDIRQWAIEHSGITYTEGDTVRLVRDIPVGSGYEHGWWLFRECLVQGATATVRKIDFYGGRWQADVVLDRQWQVHDVGTDQERRYWHGEESEMPAGYEPAHSKQGVFMLDALDVEVGE